MTPLDEALRAECERVAILLRGYTCGYAMLLPKSKEQVDRYIPILLRFAKQMEARGLRLAAAHHKDTMQHYENENCTLTMRVHIKCETDWCDSTARELEKL